MKPVNDADILQAYLDGELPSEECVALEGRLCIEPDLADALVRLSREDAVLTEWAHAQQALQVAEAPATRPVPRKRPLRRLAIIGSLSAAAALLLSFLFGPSPSRNDHPPAAPELARVEEVQGDVFVVPEAGEPFPAHTGQRLALGQGLSTHGDGSFAVVAFDDRSRLEVGADTTIRLPAATASKTVILEQGIVSADVGPQPDDRPMIVSTPHADARFQETRSSVSSTPAETRIEPEKGKVQLTRKSDGRTIDVPTGWYAVAAPTSNRFDAKPLPVQAVQPRSVLAEVTGQAMCAALSPDGGTLAIGCVDGSVKLYDLARNSVRLTLPGHKRAVRALAFSPVGNLLVCGCDDRTIRFWDPVTGTDMGFLKDVRSYSVLAFAPNGAMLATTGPLTKAGSELRIWDVATRQELSMPREQTASITAVAFSPDGRTIATAGGKESTIKLWDVSLRQVRHTLPGHAARVNSLAFSPDSRLLASGSKDRTVKLWDLATNLEVRALPIQCSEVRAVMFAPDGRLAATADQNVTLWDPKADWERLVFRGSKHAVGTILFADRGCTLITVGTDRTVRFWDTPES